MPKAPQNRIGQIFGRWRIIKENQRGTALDHGKLRSKIRNFSVECTNCGHIRENVSYKNIFYDKISHKECKTQHEKDHEGLMNGKFGESLVGQIIKNDREYQYRVLGVKIPPKGKYNYKTLEYDIQCVDCGKNKTIKYQLIISKQFNFCKCKNKINKPKKTKEEMVEEMDKEFSWMLELNKMGELNNYLKHKFPDEWDKILEDYG